MALSRVKTWVASTVLKAADLNAEFDNILNNPNTLLFPSTGAMNFADQVVSNLVIEALSSAPTPTTSSRLYWNSQTSALEVDNGAAILSIGPTSVSTASAIAPVGSRVMGLRGTISSGTGTFSADQYIMQTTNPYENAFIVVATSQMTIQMGTAGPSSGTRDKAGNIAAGSNVYWYAISTGLNSTNPCGTVSTGSPSTGGPILATSFKGWTFLAASLVGGTVNKVGANDNQTVRGNLTRFDGQHVALSSGGAVSQTNVDMSTMVPPSAPKVLLNVNSLGGQEDGAGSLSLVHSIRVVSGSDTWSSRMVANISAPGLFTFRCPGPEITIAQTSSQGFLYLNTIVSGTSSLMSVDVTGYTNPNGDA